MTTDELAAKIPSTVWWENNPYFLKIRRHSTRNRWIIEYTSNEDRNMCDTFRTGKTLKEALEEMFQLLELVEDKRPDNIFKWMIDDMMKGYTGAENE